MRRFFAAAAGIILTMGVGLAVHRYSHGESPRLTDEAIIRRALKAQGQRGPYGPLAIVYPQNGTLFPPEISVPTFHWKYRGSESNAFVVRIVYADAQIRDRFLTRQCQWTPSWRQWERIKRRSRNSRATMTVLAVDPSFPETIRSAQSVSISTSPDEVGAPIFYREVNLPFIEAVKDPSRIRWRFGPISLNEPPPVVLQNLPVCGNCHSFSADASVLGMDVDYANNHGSYAIAPVAKDMVLDNPKIITWSDYRRKDGEVTFGLLSQVSPDGRYVVSTVKDLSVFVPKPDLAFSQLFFPIKGILVVYDRETATFRALPGADDPDYVQSNPTWSPDGKYLVFARSRAYKLQGTRSGTSAVLESDSCTEFLQGGKTFVFDLYRIPFNDGNGGEPEPLKGASGDGRSNYFARYSPDGKWIVFCKARSFMLLQPDSALYIIPAEGGTARRMQCNTSRMNSWHSWSPNSKWLVFASKSVSDYTQLFLTHVDDMGNSSPPVRLSAFNADDRAANIPEFVNAQVDAITTIREQFVDDLSYVRAGSDSLRFGGRDKAEQSFRRALQANPENADAHQNLGFILLQRRMLDEARVHIEKSIELKPEDESANNNFVILLIQQGQIEEAIIQGRKTVRLDPEYAPARLNLGIALWQAGRVEDALEHLTAAARIDPGDSRAHYHLGLVVGEQGDSARAATEFNLALKCEEGFVPALVALAWIRASAVDLSLRNSAEAVTLAREACALTRSEDPMILDVLAMTYAAAGRLSDAISTARKALQIAQTTRASDLTRSLKQKIKRLEEQSARNRARSL